MNEYYDPDNWEPTGTPVEQVMWPAVAPTKGNRTAAIWNNALPQDHKWYGQNLWLTKVSTGWQLGGALGQAQKNRIFYPRNLSQLPITIEGQMPNQHQYDRLVMFIKLSHQTALNGKGSVQQPLTFALPSALINLPGNNLGAYRKDAYWDGTQIVRRYYRSMYVDGYITSIKAGHPRWNFAPKFTMDMLVSYDYIDQKVELTSKFSKLLSDQGQTFAQDNATITQNYQALLRIGKGGAKGGALSSTALPDIHSLDPLDGQAFDQGLGTSQWNVG